MIVQTLSLLFASQANTAAVPRIGIRAFKQERQMEIWGANTDRGPFHLIATYPIAALSGELGPKRREGDMQGPEGFYYVNRFNQNSQFHLSLGLNYPNSSDKKLADREHPGYDIFIHGNRVSAGCLAMTDPVIDNIYRLATHAKNAGQRAIPVSLFPCRMTNDNWLALRKQYANRPDLIHFWSTLLPGYSYFERTKLWIRPHVNKKGAYVWPELSAR